MDDTIRRQAAINTAKSMFDYCDTNNITDYRDLMIEALSVLPSVQSDLDKQELIRTITAGIIATNTKDAYSCGMRNGMRWCKSLLEEDAPKFEDASLYTQSDIPERNVGDMISRQDKTDAIDILKRNYPSSCYEDLCKAVDISIKALSAQTDLSAYSDKLWKSAYERGKSEAEQMWTPIEEHLPDLEVVVWVTLALGIRGYNIVSKAQWDGDCWHYPKSRLRVTLKVLAWMPIQIPKPYERSEE